MSSLKKSILKKGYIRIPMKITKTNHLIVKVVLNGVKGRFILDTGASNSCIGMDEVEKYAVKTTTSEMKASGAGAIGIETLQSENNHLKINMWRNRKCNLIVFDMSHVNLALEEHQVKKIHGIIGADILLECNAIVDYQNKCFYLKK
jgi:hypothetical protein